MAAYSLYRRYLTVACMLIPMLLAAGKAQAHPHYFVTVDVHIELDDQGRLVALEQQWFFDDMVSAILLEDMASVVPNRPPPAVLAAESRRLFNDLQPHQFYTQLTLDNKPLSLPAPVSHTLRLGASGEGSAQPSQPARPVLIYSLKFQWHEPVKLWDKTLSWSVYDPTYYAAYSHRPQDGVRISTGGASQCEHELQRPKPSQMMTAYALSLDQTQRDSQGLGQHFAETVRLRCHSTEAPE